MSEYVLIKLSSGEELVAESISQEDTHWILKSPRMLIMQPTGQGQMGIAIVPYSAGAPDGEHLVYTSHIVSTVRVPDKLEKAYIENVSNIQIVSG